MQTRDQKLPRAVIKHVSKMYVVTRAQPGIYPIKITPLGVVQETQILLQPSGTMVIISESAR